MPLNLPKLNINKTWLMLLVAIILALIATTLTTRYLKAREAAIAQEVANRAKQGGPKVAVVVPIQNMTVGMPLDDAVVAAREVAEDLIYPDAILADDFPKYRGQSLIRPVLKGRPLLKADLRPMYADFAGSLEPGTRAMTVDIDELNSVAHMVQPGNRIDLMLVMRRDEGGQTVVPFMDRMKVLATGQRLQSDASEEKAVPGGNAKKGGSYSTLTLEVTPTQAARITLAQELGRLRYTLRNEEDTGSAEFSVNAQNIFDEIAAKARFAKRSPSAAETGAVEFIIGGQRSGPTARSVDVSVPMGGAAPAAAPGSPIPATPGMPGYPGRVDANGLTPEMRSELKTLLDK